VGCGVWASAVSSAERVWGVGCRVWGCTNFQGVNYLIFGEKVPDSNRWHLLIPKKPKDIIQEGF